MPGIIPLVSVAEYYPDVLLKMHTAIDSAIAGQDFKTCNWLSRQLCCIAGAMSHASGGKAIIGRTDSASVAILSALRVLETVGQRFDRTHAVGISALESKSLIATSVALDAVLHTLPARCYDIAAAELEAALGAERMAREGCDLKTQAPPRTNTK